MSWSIGRWVLNLLISSSLSSKVCTFVSAYIYVKFYCNGWLIYKIPAKGVHTIRWSSSYQPFCNNKFHAWLNIKMHYNSRMTIWWWGEDQLIRSQLHYWVVEDPFPANNQSDLVHLLNFSCPWIHQLGRAFPGLRGNHVMELTLELPTLGFIFCPISAGFHSEKW